MGIPARVLGISDPRFHPWAPDSPDSPFSLPRPALSGLSCRFAHPRARLDLVAFRVPAGRRSMVGGGLVGGGGGRCRLPADSAGPAAAEGGIGSVVPAAPSAPAGLALGPGGPDGAPADQARPWSPPGLRTRGFRLGDQTFVRFGVVSRAAWLLSRASLTCGPLQLLQSLRAPAAAEGWGASPGGVPRADRPGPLGRAGRTGILRARSADLVAAQVSGPGLPRICPVPVVGSAPADRHPRLLSHTDRVRRLRPSGPAPPQLRPDWVVPGSGSAPRTCPRAAGLRCDGPARGSDSRTTPPRLRPRGPGPKPPF